MIVVLILVGFVAGVIVNALADDLPHYRRPRLPHYEDGSPKPLIIWSGLIAFLVGKRSTPNGSLLSWRYPATEVATIIGMIVVYLAKSGDSKYSDLQLVFWLYYMAVFVLITVIDIEHKLILFSVIIPSCLIAIVDALTTSAPPDIGTSLAGGAVGFGTFFVLYMGGIAYVYIANHYQGRRISEVAFGYGDVMMALLSGLIIGVGGMLFAMFITVFLGAAGALVYLVGRRLSGSGYSMITALPYGPYIVAGTAIMMLWGPQVRFLLVGY